LGLLAGAIVTAVTDGSDSSARSRMLLGSMLAGQAFANSPVAGVHALAYPLGGHYHLAHGLANALLLPHVLRFNLPVCESAYRELAVVAFPRLAKELPEQRATAFVDELTALSHACGIPHRLRDVGVDQLRIPSLAADAVQQTRLLVNNPRPMNVHEITTIYEAAW
jgi:alcohol dehydrogenase class IV